MTAQPDASPPAPVDVSLGLGKLIVPTLIGGLVALTLGVYGACTTRPVSWSISRGSAARAM
jgi:hypothetical protein